MEEGCLDKAPIHGDVKSYSPKGEAKYAEAIAAGFPCQARPAHWSARFAMLLSKSFDRLLFVNFFQL